jgi:membrane glycosyltransferase
MSEKTRSISLVEASRSAALQEAFQAEIRKRRWSVGLVTLGISLLGIWLMSDMLGATGWSALAVAQLGVFAILFTALAFGFTQAFVGFLALAEGHEPYKITNTLDEQTPLASTAVVMPVYNEDAKTVFGKVVTQHATAQRFRTRQTRKTTTRQERRDANNGIMPPIVSGSLLPKVQTSCEDRTV